MHAARRDLQSRQGKSSLRPIQGGCAKRAAGAPTLASLQGNEPCKPSEGPVTASRAATRLECSSSEIQLARGARQRDRVPACGNLPVTFLAGLERAAASSPSCSLRYVLDHRPDPEAPPCGHPGFRKQDPDTDFLHRNHDLWPLPRRLGRHSPTYSALALRTPRAVTLDVAEFSSYWSRKRDDLDHGYSAHSFLEKEHTKRCQRVR